MERTTVARVLWRAAGDEEFRSRTIENLGLALAQEGFILNDGEMALVRTWWEELQCLTARGAAERIQALARAHRR
jgi:hypothetical protein